MRGRVAVGGLSSAVELHVLCAVRDAECGAIVKLCIWD